MTIRGKVKKYTGKTKKYRGKMPGKTTIRESLKNIRKKHSEKYEISGKVKKISGIFLYGKLRISFLSFSSISA